MSSLDLTQHGSDDRRRRRGHCHSAHVNKWLNQPREDLATGPLTENCLSIDRVMLQTFELDPFILVQLWVTVILADDYRPTPHRPLCLLPCGIHSKASSRVLTRHSWSEVMVF